MAPRYLDSWVLHKTLYEISLRGGSSCACISCIPNASTFIPPTSLDTLIESISDLDTQDVKGEKSFHTFTFMNPSDSILSKDFWICIWNDRIQLRLRLKREQGHYSNFFCLLKQQQVEKDENAIQYLVQWFQQTWTPQEIHDFFQISPMELIQLFRTKYKLTENMSLDLFIPTIIEQMVQFQYTGYRLDSRGREEMEFEKLLRCDSSHYFLPVTENTFNIDMDNTQVIDHTNVMDEKKIVISALETFLKWVFHFGDPVLLDKDYRHLVQQDLDEELKSMQYPSFRYDRRIIRLVIARFWADGIRERWISYHNCDNNK